METLKKLAMSSADSEKISLTLKSLVPLAVSLALLFGVKLPADSILEGISGVVAVISGIGVVWGASRKVYLAVKNRKQG